MAKMGTQEIIMWHAFHLLRQEDEETAIEEAKQHAG